MESFLTVAFAVVALTFVIGITVATFRVHAASRADRREYEAYEEALKAIAMKGDGK